MILTDLLTDEDITLEIQWGPNSYQVKSKVLGTNIDGVVITPYVYKNTVIKLDSKKHTDMIFNIYALEPNSGNRTVWKNVQISMTKFKGMDSYSVTTKNFNKFSVENERRDNRRLKLNIHGQLYDNDKCEYGIPVMINDISDRGLSFTIPKFISFNSAYMVIGLEDIVKKHEFKVKIRCMFVRQQEVGSQYIIGCRINPTRELLTYVCLKRAAEADSVDE